MTRWAVFVRNGSPPEEAAWVGGGVVGVANFTYPTSLDPFALNVQTTSTSGTFNPAPINLAGISNGFEFSFPPAPADNYGSFKIKIPTGYEGNPKNSTSPSDIAGANPATQEGEVGDVLSLQSPNLLQLLATGLAQPEIALALWGQLPKDLGDWTVASLKAGAGVGLSQELTFTPQPTGCFARSVLGLADRAGAHRHADRPDRAQRPLRQRFHHGGQFAGRDAGGPVGVHANAFLTVEALSVSPFNKVISFGPLVDKTFPANTSNLDLPQIESDLTFGDQLATDNISVAQGATGANGGLPGTPLPSQNITVTGTVDNYAIATPTSDGDLSGSG